MADDAGIGGPPGDASGAGSGDASDTGSGNGADAGSGDASDTGSGNGADAGSGDGAGPEAGIPDDVDFDDFGPADMAKLSADEWAAAFDPDAWVTGSELLDRVEGELRSRVANREIFAAIERPATDRLRAVSDEGYATVHADGTVEGSGTVLRDVKPTVALCSMPDYEPASGGEAALPTPVAVTSGTSRLGDLMLQVVAAALLLAGVALVGGAAVGALGTTGALGVIAGLGFLVAGMILFVAVANARLSGRFRADEFRERLRAVEDALADDPGVGGGEDGATAKADGAGRGDSGPVPDDVSGPGREGGR